MNKGFSTYVITLLLLLGSVFISASASAQATDSNTLNNLQNTVNNLSDTVQQTRAEMRRININGSLLVLDSGAVAYAEAHPDSLYRHSICRPVNQHGPYAATSWLRCIITLALLLGMWIFGYQKFTESSLCRDICYDVNGAIKPYNLCPYSYSRVQLFWWTMIILTCYLYSYAITGVLMPVNETIGVLLGFSVTVYAGGRVIDNRQIIRNAPNTRTQDTQNGSQGLFTDIMSDDIGISIHRFQTVIFNMVFGLGFFFFFINGMQGHIYPFADFSAWQYGLLGISATAYLGLKTAENNPDVTPGAAANNSNNNNTNGGAPQPYNSPPPAYTPPMYVPPVVPYSPPPALYTPPTTAATPSVTNPPASIEGSDTSGITQS